MIAYKTFATNQTSVVMGSSDKKKICRKKAYQVNEYAYLAGVCAGLYELLKEHKDNPYKNMDEMLGDLQMNYTKYANLIIKKYHFRSFDKIQLEEFLE